MPDVDLLPDISVVICTRDRPELLARAIAGVANQSHAGVIETLVVFDRSDPDPALGVVGGNRPVRVMRNERTPGLPGGRNTGARHARGEFVAFCDDDDVWFPTKITRQLEALATQPRAEVVVTGVRVCSEDHQVDRVFARPELTFADLIASRVMEAHPSTVMVRRAAMLDDIGDVDESIPGGYAEDYEWLLRATRREPAVVVREPLVRVDWHPQSYFTARWRMIADALGYLLDAYPEFETDPSGCARVRGQRAFALAALHERGAWAEIGATLRRRWTEPRAALAALVAMRLVSADRVVRSLNARGRGI